MPETSSTSSSTSTITAQVTTICSLGSGAKEDPTSTATMTTTTTPGRIHKLWSGRKSRFFRTSGSLEREEGGDREREVVASSSRTQDRSSKRSIRKSKSLENTQKYSLASMQSPLWVTLTTARTIEEVSSDTL